MALVVLAVSILLIGCVRGVAPLPTAPVPQAPVPPKVPAGPSEAPAPPKAPAAPEAASEPRPSQAQLPPADPVGAVPGATPRRVPVLMYHEVGDGRNELWVSEKSFETQLSFLKEHGYQSLTLRQLQDGLAGQAPLPPRPVVLTFDDGYISHYRTVFPLLRKYGFSGVFFVYTDGVGRAGNVTWDQLREMQRGGMEIESHTVRHVDLAAASQRPDRLWDELSESRSTLQAELGVPVEYLCYPAGRFNDKVLQAARKAGYAAAFTTRPGWTDSAQDPMQWRRVRVNRSDTMSGFAAKVGAPAGGGAPEKAAGGGQS
ncbi:MAG: polysaccharide deacetylase family protein [Bacillota bacterium]